MKKYSFIALILVLLLSADYDLFAQKYTYNKRKRWSIELIGGIKSFTENNMDMVDNGFEGVFKVEKRGYGRFGFYGTLGYASFPEFTVNGNGADERLKLQFTDLNLGLGATWYILSVNLQEDFTPYLSIEFSNTFFRLSETSGAKNNNGVEYDDEYLITQSICPIIGVSYPLSETFAISARMKYTIHSFGVDDYSGGIAFDYNTLSFGLGCSILIK